MDYDESAVSTSLIISITDVLKPEDIFVNIQKLSIKNFMQLKKYLTQLKKTYIEYGISNEYITDFSKDFSFLDGADKLINEADIINDNYLSGNIHERKIKFKWMYKYVKLEHMGIIATLKLSSLFTMEMIKTLFVKSTPNSVFQDLLSLNGIPLPDNASFGQIIEQYNSKVYDDVLLTGSKLLYIQDTQCDLSHSVIVSGYFKISQIKLTYANMSQRYIYADSELTREGTDENLDNERTVLELKLQHEEVLNFKNPIFNVNIFEGFSAPSPTELSVSDNMTVRELKDLYGGKNKTPLVPKDKLYLELEAWSPELIDSRADIKNIGNRRNEPILLNDDHYLHQYKVKNGSKLFVQREKPDPDFEYLCARCGKDVRLKRADLIRCRECGYRILYKKRSTASDTSSRYRIFECV